MRISITEHVRIYNPSGYAATQVTSGYVTQKIAAIFYIFCVTVNRNFLQVTRSRYVSKFGPYPGSIRVKLRVRVTFVAFWLPVERGLGRFSDGL